MPGSYSDSPAEVLLQMLIDLDVCSEPGDGGTEGFCDRMPDRPDQLLTVFNTSGMDNGRVMQGERVELEGIQVSVRAQKEEDAWTIGQNVCNSFDSTSMRRVTVNGHQYVIWMIKRTSRVIPIGKDSNSNRMGATVNALVSMRQIS